MEYKYWFELEQVLNSVFFQIREISGEIQQSEKERLFEKYIDKYFMAWDNMSCAINGDYGYSPVYFAWWAESQNISPTYPIRICRAAVSHFLN